MVRSKYCGHQNEQEQKLSSQRINRRRKSVTHLIRRDIAKGVFQKLSIKVKEIRKYLEK